MSKRTMIPILSIIMLLSLSVTASAYVLWGYKWNTSNINYHFDNFNSSRFQMFISTGASQWNSTNATYSKSSTANILAAEVDRPDVTWDGLCSAYMSGNYFTSMSIFLNKAKTNTWNSDGALQSVATHEFGHGLGLFENGTTKTIMNAYTWGTNSRYGGYGLTTPQQDDINGVNAIY